MTRRSTVTDKPQDWALVEVAEEIASSAYPGEVPTLLRKAAELAGDHGAAVPAIAEALEVDPRQVRCLITRLGRVTAMIPRALRVSQALPEHRVARMISDEPRKKWVGNVAAGGHVVERGDHVEHGPGLELSNFPLRLFPHIVRGRPSIKDGMVPQPAVVRASVAEIDQRPYTVGETGLGDTGARRHGVGELASRASLDGLRQRAERPGFDRRPHRQLAVVGAVDARLTVVEDVAVLAAVYVAEARFDGRLAVANVGIEARLEIPTVGPMPVRDDAGKVRAKHELDLRERPNECDAQRLISIVDGADLVEGDSRTEVIVPEMGSLLKVACIAGEPVVVRCG